MFAVVPIETTVAAMDEGLAVVESQGRSQRTGLPGREVVWRIWGEGPAVLLLHGNFGAWSHWIRNVRALAKHFTVYVPDMPGFGDSDMLENVTLEAISAAMSQGLDQLMGVRADVRIVGFSLGSTIAGCVAQTLTSRVAALVITSAGQIGLKRSSVAPLVSWRGLPPTEHSDIHRQNLATMMIADASRIDALAIAIQAANTQKARAKTAPLTASHPLRNILVDLTCPVHGVWGACDATIGPHMAERIAFLQSLSPRSKAVVIKEAGHWVAFERPEAYNASLLRLLSTVVHT